MVNSGILPNDNDLIEAIMNVGQNIAVVNPFKIELVNEREYPIYTNGSGDINVNARDTQLYFTKGFTAVKKMERIDWKTKNQFRWNDGTGQKITQQLIHIPIQ